MKTDILIKELEAEGISFSRNKSFKSLTSFKTGAEAAFVLYPESTEHMIFIRELSKREGIPLIVLGCGSNCLAPDEFFEGMVVVTREKMGRISLDKSEISAQSGASLSAIALLAKESGLTGLEFSYGIPGSLGGAVLMNAGAYGGEMKDVIKSVTYLDENNNICTADTSGCLFEYRSSLFSKKDYFIISAVLSLKEGNREQIKEKMEQILLKRREKQPLEYPSAGSVFKRPKGCFAAALIEECGLKGMSVGDAQVSQKHSGFIINKGSASSEDVKQLCQRVHDIVLEEKNVSLELEIRFL